MAHRTLMPRSSGCWRTSVSWATSTLSRTRTQVDREASSPSKTGIKRALSLVLKHLSAGKLLAGAVLVAEAVFFVWQRQR
jgi:hypothetical protein